MLKAQRANLAFRPRLNSARGGGHPKGHPKHVHQLVFHIWAPHTLKPICYILFYVFPSFISMALEPAARPSVVSPPPLINAHHHPPQGPLLSPVPPLRPFLSGLYPISWSWGFCLFLINSLPVAPCGPGWEQGWWMHANVWRRRARGGVNLSDGGLTAHTGGERVMFLPRDRAGGTVEVWYIGAPPYVSLQLIRLK